MHQEETKELKLIEIQERLEDLEKRVEALEEGTVILKHFTEDKP